MYEGPISLYLTGSLFQKCSICYKLPKQKKISQGLDRLLENARVGSRELKIELGKFMRI